ncbi:FtsQ-type POTRA domain-containing protein [Nevskia sp.]|uniref:cell division protein FtsQ/DivIB n=1 Tax=Nevskia sp. TaxID=1929292 RepID=UPI0025DA1E2C|nr:FtsQ-type POTRA domain-containing protein [Nevskia sp.]
MSATMLRRHHDDEPATWPRYLRPALMTAAVLAIAVVAAQALAPLVNPPVDSIRIDGAMTRLKAADIALAADLEPDQRLFDTDLLELRARIEALPWVSSAQVSRVWPDKLAVKLTERTPFARWGESRVIDRDSRVFTPASSEIPQELPLLSAPPGHEAEAAAVFEELRLRLSGNAFAPMGLSLDARGEWRMTSRIGIELRLGQGDPRTRVPLILGTVSDTLNAQLEKVAYVDLRYSNGFSVGWKDGVSPLASATAKPADGTTH